MKKLVFSIVLLMGLGLNAFGAVIGVASFAALTSGGTKAGEWDILYDTNNVTYNSQSGYWVTNATHYGDGYL